MDRLTESAKGSGGEALAPGILLQALPREALGKFCSKLDEEKREAKAEKLEDAQRSLDIDDERGVFCRDLNTRLT
eukprot:SAG22_NODE_1321_length_4757_cov_1.980678_2_plen_75_part_00